MIKNVLITCIVFFISTTISAQDIYKPDKRLNDCIDADILSQMVSSKSELIPYYNYYIDHSYYVVDLKKAEKEVTGKDIHTVVSRAIGNKVTVLFNEISYTKETFNPLKYNFNIMMNSFVTYIWKEAGIALVFYPQSQISAAYKEASHKEK
jgi:hypothetical protein